MKTLLAPAIALMNRLKYPQKFVLVGLLLVLPLIVVLYQFMVQIQKDLDFAAKERSGLVFNEPLVQVLQVVQQHRGLANAYLNGDTTFRDALLARQGEIIPLIERVNTAERDLGGILGTATRWATIKTDWEALRKDVLTLTPQESFQRHTILIDELLKLVTVVGNNSNLILDPDIDSYYFMDNVITQLPQGAEYMGQMRAIGMQILARGETSPEDRTRLVILTGLVRSRLANTVQGFDYIYEVNPGLRNTYEPAIKSYTLTVEDYLAL